MKLYSLPRSVLRATLLLGALLAVDGQCIAQTVVAVTDSSFPRNQADYTLGGPNENVVVVSWTQTSSASNATIAASLQSNNPSLDTGTAYLMNAIGPGTTVANEVVAPVSFTPAATPPYTSGLLPLTVLFTGVQLNPGTYYLVLTAPSGSSAGWYFASAPQVTNATSVTLGSSYLANLAIGSAINSFAPASSFVNGPAASFVFDVFVGSQVIFEGEDRQTQGNWTFAYGSGGYAIPNDVVTPLEDMDFSSGGFTYTWAGPWAGLDSDPRALLTGPDTIARIASAYAYYSGQSFSMNLNIYGPTPHTVGFYLLDFDTTSREETITITDASTGQSYAPVVVDNFHDGCYVFFQLLGNLRVEVTPDVGAGPVISGVFVD